MMGLNYPIFRLSFFALAQAMQSIAQVQLQGTRHHHRHRRHHRHQQRTLPHRNTAAPEKRLQEQALDEHAKGGHEPQLLEQHLDGG